MTVLKSIKKAFKLAAMATIAPLTLPSTAIASGLALGPVTFSAPLVLMGAVALPVLWWLMKSTPTKPTIEAFPAMRILFNMKSQDQEPAIMPLWQRLLRMTAATMIIAGLAQPSLNPDEPLKGDGSIMMVVDNGWAAARNWSERTEEMKRLLDRAARDGRQVSILSTAPPEDGGIIRINGPLDADDAQHIINELKPRPWPVDREAALKALKTPETAGSTSVIWLSNGLDGKGTLALASRLQKFGTLTILEDAPQETAQLLIEPSVTSDALAVTVRRLAGSKNDVVSLTARDESGDAIAQVTVNFEPGKMEKKATFDLPIEIKNQITRIAIDGENTAGATVLLDERWRRRPVGLITAGAKNTSQPLLNESNYIERALDPYADLHQGAIGNLLQQKLAVMIMTDSIAIDETTGKKVKDWVNEGGTLLRFAGPRLAEQTNDDLLPVKLRQGERILGGKMSGTMAGKLAPFEPASPFYGINLPGDVTIEREVLAQPGLDLDKRTWASLKDGTPFVTAEKRGKGWIVLVHTTADRDWSNLVLSGLFVDMMRAVVSHSQGISGGADGLDNALPPLKILNGHGQLIDPLPAVMNLTKEAVEQAKIGPQFPPGFYGNENIRQAHNLSAAVPVMKALPDIPENVSRGTYKSMHKETDLAGPLLSGGFALVLIDHLLLLGQRGVFSRSRRKKQKQKPVSPKPIQAAP